MSIGLDIDKIKNHLDNYIKDKSPTEYPVSWKLVITVTVIRMTVYILEYKISISNQSLSEIKINICLIFHLNEKNITKFYYCNTKDF